MARNDTFTTAAAHSQEGARMSHPNEAVKMTAFAVAGIVPLVLVAILFG